MAQQGAGKLKILHVLRAPLGGLFRHVLDLTRGQVARGHAVGLVTDSTTGGERAAEILRELAPSLELGVTRVPMLRNPGWTDVQALRHVARRIADTGADVVHGHGSKGGAYARAGALLRRGAAVRAYTPHGGSFNYRPGAPIHRFYMGVEGALRRATDIYLFESQYIASCFHNYVGPTRTLERIALNGISPAEFVPVEPDADAAEFLYVGELRSAKGIDILIAALARVSAEKATRPRLVLVGSGPDERMLTEQAQGLGVSTQVTFAGAMPARRAFQLGRVMVVPSRAESLPYIVLEAAGAQAPLISTDVGGIPEIFGPYASRLIACDDVDALAARMSAALTSQPEALREDARTLAAYVQRQFALDQMIDTVLDGYREAIARRQASVQPSLQAPLAAPRNAS